MNGEELHRPSSPALVYRAGLRQGQDFSTQQVSLRDQTWASHNKLEWSGVVICEPRHETSLSLESGRSGNEAKKWWEGSRSRQGSGMRCTVCC